MKKLFSLVLLLFSVGCLFSQNVITGTVSGENGEVLTGVRIMEKGTSNGTLSDLTGNYQLKISGEETTLEFSFFGFTAKLLKAKAGQQLDVTLVEGLALDGVQIVGSRNLNRSATETPVAVDIIEMKDVTSSGGQLDVNQLLQYVAPSFNANRQSGADGSDHIDPATLRGLGPDQTLVLVNGKRRHQSSLINIFGTRGRGNTGTDLNAIPVSAIERIEILRDGASAQYGSDAIAGVINIVLKSSTDEFSANVTAGMRNANPSSDNIVKEDLFDGQSINVNGNYGMKIGEDGFVNVTMDYLTKGHTNRAADPTKYDIYREQFGDASAKNFGTYLNSRIPTKMGDLYAFGGYNFRATDAYAWTRDPGSDRNVPEIYPNGFNPHITSDVADISFSAGFNTQYKGWDIDINNTTGKNRFHYIIDGTLNASMLENSPTRFDAGGFSLMQNTTGINFSKYYENVLKGLNVAFGSEHRIDNYQIFAGEEGSYRNYGLVDTVVNGLITQTDQLGRPGGSQGFPGFRPENEVDEYRTNLGAYVDLELDITDDFMIGLAGRVENYSDFGMTSNFKVASRYSFAKAFNLRGSFSTGFRAPSLAQSHFNSTFTDFEGGVAVDKVIAKNNSPITRALGIPELKQETAVNASLGIAGKVGAFTYTIDGYMANIRDRVVLTGAFYSDDPLIGTQLQNLGVGAAQFFTNALDTRTMGIDVILSYTHTFANSRLKASLAGNFNKMSLGDIHTTEALKGKEETYFGMREQYFLLASAPPMKLVGIVDYKAGKFGVNLRANYFDKVTLIDWLDEEDVYDAKVTLDLSVGYDITKNIKLTLGGTNLMNVYPTEQDTETETGGLWDAVQMGSNGAFYFTRLGFNF